MGLLDIMKAKTLRFRMIILFCSVVAGLLAVSYLAFWALLDEEVGAQLNRQLLETARPIISDLIAEPNVEDVSNLNIPDEYFELLNPDGVVLQRSKNLSSPLKGINPRVSEPTFGTGSLDNGHHLRLALIPFQMVKGPRVLAVAVRTSRFGSTLEDFGSVALLIFPLSLLLTAGISTFYVGKSLAPITALTNHAALMAKRVTNREGYFDLLEFLFPALEGPRGRLTWRSTDYPIAAEAQRRGEGGAPLRPIWERVIRHVVLAMTGLEEAKNPSLAMAVEGTIDLFFSDSHLPIREEEIRKFLPQISPNGLILMHDTSSHYKIAREAAFRLEQEGLLSIVLLPTPRGMMIAQKRLGRK